MNAPCSSARQRHWPVVSSKGWTRWTVLWSTRQTRQPAQFCILWGRSWSLWVHLCATLVFWWLFEASSSSHLPLGTHRHSPWSSRQRVESPKHPACFELRQDSCQQVIQGLIIRLSEWAVERHPAAWSRTLSGRLAHSFGRSRLGSRSIRLESRSGFYCFGTSWFLPVIWVSSRWKSQYAWI